MIKSREEARILVRNELEFKVRSDFDFLATENLFEGVANETGNLTAK